MLRRLAKWLRDENGAIAPMLVLLLIPMIGMVSIGGEVASWYAKQRQLQNAADSAVLAAAANGGSGYALEAKGVVTNYGFLNNANGDVTVAASNTATCPGTGTATCYSVAISQKVPLYLTQLIGYKGNGVAMASGRMATTVAAAAIASSKSAYNYCIVGLGTSGNVKKSNGDSIELNGNGSGFGDCAARSNGSVKCTSNDFAMVLAPSQSSCAHYTPAAANFTDPYAGLGLTAKIAASLAAAPACGSSPLAATVTVSVTVVCSTNNTMSQNVNIVGNGIDPVVLIVNNTTLNTAGFTLTITGTAGGTVIFTGPSTTNMAEWFSGDGDVYVKGANGGTYDDFALIADPKYTSTADFRPGAGSHVETWTLGTLYAPNTNVGVEGSMHSVIGSRKCASLIVKSVYANGGSLENNPQDCIDLGYNLPETVITRQALLQ